MKLKLLLLFLVGLLLPGCGGGGNQATGDVSGFVQDISGNPVRDALVYVDNGPQTYSNSSGSYVLSGVYGDVVTIKATTNQDGVNYYGENVVQIFNGERSKSTNITMSRESQQATLTGTVRDRNGYLVQGAHVFAAAVNNGQITVWSSTLALTDSNGQFSIPTLLGGQDYSIIASARGYNSDTETVNVAAGQSQNLDFTLKNATDPLLSPPANVEAIAWTTPGVPTGRAANQQSALNAIKSMIEPKRSQWKVTRDTSGGNFVEIDLDWSPMSDPSLIGFGIYRASGNVAYQNLVPIDFYRDPQATLYEDLDGQFQENQTYTYAVTAYNTNAPNTGNSESDFSNLVVATTLGDMNLNAVTSGATFNWQLVSGADSYTVYVFDRYPSIGISSIWTGTTSGSSLAYAGSPLTSGHTYYYVVMGEGNGGLSRTLSWIDSFVAP